ncbi:MAG: hypothetical protein ACR2IP_03495 [Solirubrobacteraceae bacterium]
MAVFVGGQDVTAGGLDAVAEDLGEEDDVGSGPGVMVVPAVCLRT